MTCDQSRSYFKASIAHCCYKVLRHPMPVSFELVVEYYEQCQHEAYAEDLGAIICRRGETKGNESPSQQNSIF
jgi:hypothetical protein